MVGFVVVGSGLGGAVVVTGGGVVVGTVCFVVVVVVGSSVVTVVVVPSGRVMVVTRVERFDVVVVFDVVDVVGSEDVVRSTEDVVTEVGSTLSASRTASLRGGCCAGVSVALSEPAAKDATAAKTVAITTPEAARMTWGAPRKRVRLPGSGLSYTKFPLLKRQRPKFWVQRKPRVSSPRPMAVKLQFSMFSRWPVEFIQPCMTCSGVR